MNIVEGSKGSKRRNPLRSLRQLKTYNSNHPSLNSSLGKINLTSNKEEAEAIAKVNYYFPF